MGLLTNINLKFKYFILSLQKNIMSYNEELFIYIIYVILFVILFLYSIDMIKVSTTNVYTGSAAFYEKSVFVKSSFLQVIKKNYLLLTKKGSLKKYIKKWFIYLKKSEKKIKKKIKEKIKKVYWKNLSNVVWEVLRLLKNVKKKKINYDNI